MDSRVSNREAKFNEFIKSQDEFRISQAKFRAEVKTTNDLILLQLKLLAEKLGVESSAATLMHQPFVKMASPISVEKSNQVVIQLQSFHEEKIRAREKVAEFWSQFCLRYKPKNRPCLRPISKKFKTVRDYGKHHDDDPATFRSNPRFQESFGFLRSELARKNETVFDLLDKQVEDSVESPPFLHSDCKIGTAKKLVSGLLISELLEKRDDLPSSRPILEIMVGFQLFVFVGTISGLQSLKILDKEALKQFGFMGFDHCFPLDFSGSYALQVFDKRSHSADCDFQLGYHMPISDTGGTLCGFLTSNVQNKDAHISKFLICNGKFMKNRTIVHLKFGFHKLILDKGGTTIQRLINSKSPGKDVSAQLLDTLPPFGGFYNDAIVSVSFQFTHHTGIRDKGGTVYLSEFNSMDLLAICELGFALTAKNRNFSENLILRPGLEEFIADAYKEGIYVVVLTTYSKSGDQIARLSVEKLGEERISKLKIVGHEEVEQSLYTQLVNDTDLWIIAGNQSGAVAGLPVCNCVLISNTHFSCLNESRNFIDCSQDGMIGVVLLVAYTTCIVVCGVFCSTYIELSRAGKMTFLIVSADYMVHSCHMQKKLPFASSVHGAFGLQDTSPLLEGGKGIYTTTVTSGLLTGRRMMTMTDIGILKHFNSEYVERRKLDAAFTVANHIPKLEDESSILGSLLLKLWSGNLIWGASVTLLPIVEAIIAIPPCTIMIVWVCCQHLCTEYATGLKTLRTRSLIMGGCIMAWGSQWSSLEVVQLCRSNSSGFSVSSLAARLILWGKTKSSKTSKMQPRENYLVCRYYQPLTVEGTQLDMSVVFQFILFSMFHVSCWQKHLGPQVPTTVPLPVITDAAKMDQLQSWTEE